MRHAHRTALLIAALAAYASTGCSQIQTVFHQPTATSERATPAHPTRSAAPASNRVDNVQTKVGYVPDAPNKKQKKRQLAVSQPDPRSSAPRAQTAAFLQSPPHNPQRTTDAKAVEKNRDAKPTQKPTDIANATTNGVRGDGQENVIARKPNAQVKPRFTAPSAPYRNFGTLTGLAVLGTMTTGSSDGSALSQSRVTTETGTVGPPGLAAPSPTTAGVRNSANLLVSGPVTALRFSGQNTIFQRQVNLASGPGGAVRRWRTRD
ncbi:MAG: hypothetical protein GXP29_07515 [Planctomycetes bacterium]|nr:hypothetical protein [Planctomycetota bacterium]